MKVVISLGDSALVQRGERMDAEVQRGNIARAAAVIARIAARHVVLVTHGNTPLVGLLAAQAEAYAQVPPYPLDLLGAEAEGMVGYLIEQELRNRLPDREVVTLLTQVEVSPRDPAFARPSMLLGPACKQEQAERLAQQRGWKMVAVSDHLWRRAVPAPEPLRIVELGAIRLLLEGDAVIVCAGGGGIPVVVTPTGQVRGVDAAVDKDYAAALLAREIGADALLLLTDVDAAYTAWGTNFKQPIRETMPEALRKLAFAPGSMGTKVEAACRFVESSRGFAGIGLLEDAERILEGARGTIVRRSGVSLDFVPRPGARAPAARGAGPATKPPRRAERPQPTPRPRGKGK
jgi:carbamate kinase